MRLAVFNVENLFDRAIAMNHGTWETGKTVLEEFSKLNKLLGQERYSDADKTDMAALIVSLGMAKSDTGPFVILRRNKGRLLKRPKTGGIEIIADGRFDWTGSLELRDEPVNERAMQNTARVIHDLKADVLGVVEAESRPVLSAFNQEILPVVDGVPFRHVMLIDGNDERGIDVGLMTGDDFPIGLMRSHVDDRASPEGQPIFSRDCPEFQVATKNGETLVVLVNHFKSKGYGDLSAASRRRRAQAQRAREICDGLMADGFKYVALIGDLNDTPESHALEPLTTSVMKDAFNHPLFDKGGFDGTYGNCSEKNKIDYLFLSPELYGKVSAGGVLRKGIWAGVRAKRWENYPEMTEEEEAASDHAALWVDLDI